MAKISLRAYNREIEEMIAHNQFDQAIAHCRNILTIYPKHINTYRLLGKSFLENQRYGDAGDIFQRVLSSFPEDFISHVGMSIIREDEGNLDDALWHMERAFELQPSNNAVQGELRRLHGKREGVEPLKIRLTRGALAQMYLRGDLYVQAIAELRIALTEDPSRFDLQTNLAKAYYLSGQLAEAAKICNEIINKLPYSYEANRILAEIYKKSDRLPEAQPFLQKLYELDPYYAHLTENAPTPDQVNDSEVILEKLDWQPGAAIPMIATQPEWATSIGISMDNKETPDENLPDWLTSTEETTQKPIEEIKPVGELLEEEEEKTQPDWLSPEPSAETPGEGLEVLKESEQISEEFSFPGEEPSQEETIQFTEDEDKLAKETDLSGVEEIAPAEIPDWLQSLAPDQSQKPLEVSKGVSAIPSAAEKEISWLEETASVEGEPIIEALESTEPFITSENEAEETPTWLQQSDIQPEMLHSEIFEPEKEEFLSEVSTSDDSTEPFSADRKDDFAWLSESDINQSESEPIEEDSLWIEEPEEENLARINAEDDIAPAEEVELPEWLSQMKHDMEAKAQAAKSEEEIPGWLNTIDEPPISEEDTKPSRLLKKLRPEAIFPSGASTPDISLYEPSGIAEETPLSSIFSDESLEFKEEAREIDSAEFSETNETEKQLEWISEISSEKPFETELSEETGKDFYPEETEEIQKETSPVEEVQLPDWLSQVSDETIEKTAPILEQKPDWLSEEPLEPIEEPEKKEEEKPIWLSEEPLEPIEEPEKKVEEKLIWVSEEPLEPIEEPEKKEEEKPIWLSDEPLEPIEEPEKKEEEKPTWLSEEPFEPAEEPENKEEEKPVWLSEVTPETIEKTEERPEWLGDYEKKPSIFEDMADTQQAEEPVFESQEYPFEEPHIERIEESALTTGVEENISEGITQPSLEPLPDWLQEYNETEAPAEEQIQAASEEQPIPEMPAWFEQPEKLSTLDLSFSEEIPVENLSSVEETYSEPAAAEAEMQPEEPAREIGEETQTEIQLEEITEETHEEPLVEAQEEVSPEIQVEEFSIEAQIVPIDLNYASLVELERLPGVGFIKAQNIINYRNENGLFNSVEELINVPGMDEELIQELKPRLEVILPAEELPELVDETEEIDPLIQARHDLENGNLNAAVNQYLELIYAKSDLNEIIDDLKNALDRYPTESELWQTMGDACLRMGKLQDALNAYIEAEKLVR